MVVQSFPVDRWAIEELVPHAAPMVLLDEIKGATVGSLRALATIDAASPFYSGADSISAWWAIEYMAQGVATYAGLRDRLAGRAIPIGFLTSCRRFTSSSAVIRTGSQAEISINEVVSMTDSLAVFDCQMQADDFSAAAVISVYASNGATGE
jgi:predicted hotdog family 3-hydroxylacyl-ACP dehydratase